MHIEKVRKDFFMNIVLEDKKRARISGSFSK